MTCPDSPRSDRIGWSIVAAACLVAWALLLSGCKSSHHVVGETSAIVTARPDTVLVTTPPPMPKADVRTMPTRVERYRQPDTSRQIAEVTAVVVDRRVGHSPTVTVRTTSGSSTFALPATGEVLSVTAARDCTAVASVGGKQVDVVAPEREPTWWDEFKGFVVGMLALIGFAALLVWFVRR